MFGGELMNDEYVDLAHGHALHNLDADEERQVADILTGPESADFEATVRQTSETLASLSSVTLVEPPPALRSRLLAQISAESNQPPGAIAAPAPQLDELAERRSSKRGRWRIAVAAAAAAVVLLAGGVFIGQQLQTEQTPSTASTILNASDARTADAAVATGGTATVVYSVKEHAAVVIMNDVAKLPAESVYQMWLIPSSGNPVSAGLIATDTVAATTTAVVSDVGDATAWALSIEPAGGSPQPTNPIVKVALA